MTTSVDNFQKAFSVFVAMLVFTFAMTAIGLLYLGLNDMDKTADKCISNGMQWYEDDSGSTSAHWVCIDSKVAP